MSYHQPWVSDSIRNAYLRLAFSYSFGAQKWAAVQAATGCSVDGLSRLSEHTLQACGFTAAHIAIILGNTTPPPVAAAMNWHQPQLQRWVVTIEDSSYPALLKEIASPPLVLLVQGNLALLQQSCVAIVGCRQPTFSGKALGYQFAQELAKSGLTIVSGMALGIDQQAHKGAIEQTGETIGVLGCGIDQVYPKRNQRLYQELIERGGLLVSEYYPGVAPHKSHFPRRNRIVSGLSLGVLVVEAALKSGSLITARQALEQNREVFAIPSNIRTEQSQGCHFLIQQGAKLVTCVEDILIEFQELNHLALMPTIETAKKSPISLLATPDLLDSVEFDVTSIDIITERSKLPVHEVMAALLEYELRGLVASTPGGYVKLRGK